MSGRGEGRDIGRGDAREAGVPADQPAKAPSCPICGKPRDPDYRPFCSKRCADVDLGRWLSASYAIPVTEEDDEDGDTPADGAPPSTDRPGRDDGDF